MARSKPSAPLVSRFGSFIKSCASSGQLTSETFVQLQDRSVREQTRTFAAEGIRFALSAILNKTPVLGIAVCPELLGGNSILESVRRFGGQGGRVLRLSELEFREIVHSADPQGIAFIAEMGGHRLIDQKPRSDDVWVALDSVRTPGNLGTILRTCEAVGARGVLLIGGESDPYDRHSVRASMGAIFSQKIIRTSAKALAGWKSRNDALFVGASLEGSVDYRSVCCRRRPIVLVMGNERTGLRPKQVALCDRLARIPMPGPTDSLNLAVATAVLLYEVYGQRHPVGQA